MGGVYSLVGTPVPCQSAPVDPTAVSLSIAALLASPWQLPEHSPRHGHPLECQNEPSRRNNRHE